MIHRQSSIDWIYHIDYVGTKAVKVVSRASCTCFFITAKGLLDYLTYESD